MLLNLRQKNDSIQVKGSKLLYVHVSLALLGSLVGLFFLFRTGIKFESHYSFYYLGVSIIFTPFMLYLALWHLSGFIPGKVLIKIIPGENGEIKSGGKSVKFKDINEVSFYRRPINLMNVILLETRDGKKVRIPTYNLIADWQVDIMVDKYIYPHMNEQARKVWDRKIDLKELFESTTYKREESGDTPINH
ncbi:DUF5381 family protein [Mesobacillus zeae]|uniref:YfjD family protein n=1 Tax=Mesobacillus zeae TaxID=1917180 RepID=A0A398BH05_9BACI|nr:DUF5381 family protein [Mesobacillus zeae]RID86763.1 hypothetical protein D1970_05770 [Mesobacillus zeae]